MRVAITALIFAMISAAPLASAQSSSTSAPAPITDNVAISSSRLYDACIANNQGPPAECACMAGFYGGRLNENEFRLLAVLNTFIDARGDVADMPGAQAALRAEAGRLGMTQSDFQSAMQRFSTLDADGAYGDRVCTVLW
jgi:hypothetical protein